MKTLFEHTVIGGIKIKNRLLRSATFENGANEDGLYSQRMTEIYAELANGGIGAIITGMVGIDENSRVNSHMVKTYDDTFTERLSELSQTVHSCDCALIVQIAHCGAKVPQTDSGDAPFGMSSLPEREIREFTKTDIQRLTEDFAKSALRCKNAGADGVQVHASHGYLISQALSPIFNKREDEYGGTIENRARLLFDVCRTIRNAVGNDYPVWVKINSDDYEKGGLTRDESLWVCQQVSKLGIDAIEVSGGIAVSRESAPARPVHSEQQEGYFFDNALAIAETCETDIISVGGYRSVELMEHKLNQGNIKGFSLSRPLIAEPDLVNRWKSGDLAQSKCISCNKCFSPGRFGCRTFPR
jgi:2,4-dienoyl-CoA reductase-like NADH-dependent reductase (Old Yellow Enzyme family)